MREEGGSQVKSRRACASEVKLTGASARSKHIFLGVRWRKTDRSCVGRYSDCMCACACVCIYVCACVRVQSSIPLCPFLTLCARTHVYVCVHIFVRVERAIEKTLKSYGNDVSHLLDLCR